MRLVTSLVVTFTLGILCIYPTETKAEFEELFDHHPLQNRKWNFCQTAVTLNEPYMGESGVPETAYRFGIDRKHRLPDCNCGTGVCSPKSGPTKRVPEEEEDYYEEETPLLLSFKDPKSTGPCIGYDPDRVKRNYVWDKKNKKYVVPIQKNELRLWKDDWPAANLGYWYSFRFKIDETDGNGNKDIIDRCGSMRWVGGQFKAYKMDKSPFIAQRFDNGVFHITIEALHHREKNTIKRQNSNA